MMNLNSCFPEKEKVRWDYLGFVFIYKYIIEIQLNNLRFFLIYRHKMFVIFIEKFSTSFHKNLDLRNAIFIMKN